MLKKIQEYGIDMIDLIKHNTDVAVPVILGLIFISLIFGMIGLEKSRKKKLAVFTGKFDVAISIIALLSPLLWHFSLQENEKNLEYLSVVIGVISGFCSICLAYKANDSFLKMVFVIPAKILYCLSLSLLLLVMLGGAMAAKEAVKEKKYKEAAFNAGISATAGMGAYKYMGAAKIMMKEKNK